MSYLPYPEDGDGDDHVSLDTDDTDAYDRDHTDEEEDDLGQGDTDTPITSSSGEKRTRGIVTMASLKRARSKGKALEVSFNEYGHPIGKESEKFSYYLEAAVRRVIPIVLPSNDWGSRKLDHLKEMLWNELVTTFIGLDQTKKKHILKQAGLMAKNFRARLRRNARDSETGLYSPTPPIFYENSPMVAPYWGEFVRKAMEVDFKKKSERNREQAKMMDARYRGSNNGYAHIRNDMKEEKKKVGDNASIATRHELFHSTRKTRDGNIPDSITQRIIEEAIRISQIMTPDEARTIETARAIGRQEHPNRMQSTGYGITKTSLEMAPGILAMSMADKLSVQVANLAKELELMIQGRSGHGMSSTGAS